MKENRPFWIDFYPDGVRPNLQYPNTTLYNNLEQAAAKYPDKTATVFMGGKLTYTRLKDQVDRLARALSDLGVGKGDRVGLMLPNIPQEVIGFYAVMRLGPWGWVSTPCIPKGNCLTSSRTPGRKH